MKPWNLVWEFFERPFPVNESRWDDFKLVLGLSIFVALFLYIFQPFGIATIEQYKFWKCVGFGSMTLLAALVYELTVGFLFRAIGWRDRWTFGKWILYNIGVMLLISMFNFLFARLAFFGFIQWNLFPAMLYGTFMIGLIPLVVYGGIVLLRQEHKYQGIADEINQKPATLDTIQSNQKLTILDIPVAQIKYVEALQNYIKIGYISTDGEPKEQVIRATLKQCETQAEHTSIIRCHRSFMVNQAAIIATSGNAQGLLLTLSDCEKSIPVSRSYVPKFR